MLFKTDYTNYVLQTNDHDFIINELNTDSSNHLSLAYKLELLLAYIYDRFYYHYNTNTPASQDLIDEQITSALWAFYYNYMRFNNISDYEERVQTHRYLNMVSYIKETIDMIIYNIYDQQLLLNRQTQVCTDINRFIDKTTYIKEVEPGVVYDNESPLEIIEMNGTTAISVKVHMLDSDYIPATLFSDILVCLCQLVIFDFYNVLIPPLNNIYITLDAAKWIKEEFDPVVQKENITTGYAT